jgi:glycosidase
VSSESPAWVDHVIWWQVYPLGFTGAEPVAMDPAAPPHHRLAHLRQWLDHLIALGCNGLALGPVFASGTHGYDTTDYFRIDPRLGDEADFDALVKDCRERGIRVLLDGVFNHAGRGFPPVRQALEQGPRSEAGAWIRWSGDHPYYFEGHDRLVTFDHGAPVVRDHVAEVMAHWLERGIDGWRLDAAYAVPPEFWASVLSRVRDRFPGAWFAGEMIHGDYPDYVRRSGIDTVTQYELWKAIWSSLNDRNLWELDWALRRHREMTAEFRPLTFLGNHDVTRIASRIADERHLAHAVALLFFLPGVPSVYYGDEYAMRAVKEDRPGGDDAIRPRMPEHPPPLTDDLYQRMIGVRRRHAWLAGATIGIENLANHHLVVTAEAAGHGRLALVLNLADEPFRHGLPGEVIEAGSPAESQTVAPHSWAVIEGVRE